MNNSKLVFIRNHSTIAELAMNAKGIVTLEIPYSTMMIQAVEDAGINKHFEKICRNVELCNNNCHDISIQFKGTEIIGKFDVFVQIINSDNPHIDIYITDFQNTSCITLEFDMINDCSIYNVKEITDGEEFHSWLSSNTVNMLSKNDVMTLVMIASTENYRFGVSKAGGRMLFTSTIYNDELFENMKIGNMDPSWQENSLSGAITDLIRVKKHAFCIDDGGMRDLIENHLTRLDAIKKKMETS